MCHAYAHGLCRDSPYFGWIAEPNLINFASQVRKPPMLMHEWKLYSKHLNLPSEICHLFDFVRLPTLLEQPCCSIGFVSWAGHDRNIINQSKLMKNKRGKVWFYFCLVVALNLINFVRHSWQPPRIARILQFLGKYDIFPFETFVIFSILLGFRPINNNLATFGGVVFPASIGHIPHCIYYTLVYGGKKSKGEPHFSQHPCFPTKVAHCTLHFQPWRWWSIRWIMS